MLGGICFPSQGSERRVVRGRRPGRLAEAYLGTRAYRELALLYKRGD
jgi:hypothetical protein